MLVMDDKDYPKPLSSSIQVLQRYLHHLITLGITTGGHLRTSLYQPFSFAGNKIRPSLPGYIAQCNVHSRRPFDLNFLASAQPRGTPVPLLLWMHWSSTTPFYMSKIMNLRFLSAVLTCQSKSAHISGWRQHQSITVGNLLNWSSLHA